MVNDDDLVHLRRAVALAEQALEAGDEPFGSVLVSGDGVALAEDHNHVAGGDHTQHPEFALARWSAEHLSVEERHRATVYTSGEHCPMCSAAHAWVGLGRIVYATSGEQTVRWVTEAGAPPSPVALLRIPDVAPGLVVDGPDDELAERVHALHRRFHAGS